MSRPNADAPRPMSPEAIYLETRVNALREKIATREQQQPTGLNPGQFIEAMRTELRGALTQLIPMKWDVESIWQRMTTPVPNVDELVKLQVRAILSNIPDDVTAGQLKKDLLS
jgi:hypothetical protein